MDILSHIQGLPAKLEICGYYQAQRYLVVVGVKDWEKRLWLPQKPFRYLALLAEAYCRDSSGWVVYGSLDGKAEQRFTVYQLRKHIDEQLGDGWLHPVEVDTAGHRARLNVNPSCRISFDAERLSAIADVYIQRCGFRLLADRRRRPEAQSERPGEAAAVSGPVQGRSDL